jgi:hypothetical protein
LAATKIDEDVKNELIPYEFKNINELSKEFGVLLSRKSRESAKTPSEQVDKEDYSAVDLPPFIKQVLINIVKNAFSLEKD